MPRDEYGEDCEPTGFPPGPRVKDPSVVSYCMVKAFLRDVDYDLHKEARLCHGPFKDGFPKKPFKLCPDHMAVLRAGVL